MLLENYQRFVKHSQGLKEGFHMSQDIQVDVRDASQQMLVVRLQDYWGHFVERLIVLSASGKATTISGKSVINHHEFHGITKVNEWLLHFANGVSSKPNWHVNQESIGIAKRLRVSNYPDISAALGSTNSPEGEIRTHRNFIVHRNKDTATKAKEQYRRLGYRNHDFQFLPSEFSDGGELVFDRWIRDLQLVAKVASK